MATLRLQRLICTRQISTATWAGSLPDNLSYLAPTQFELLVKKLPNTKYFATGVNIPSVTVGESIQPTPLGANIKLPGDKIAYGEMTITFIVDENMENWTELFTWMEGITASTDTEKELYSDMTIVVTTAANNPNRYIRIADAYPSSLGEIAMDTTVAGGLSYVTCTASFQFTSFEIASTS